MKAYGRSLAAFPGCRRGVAVVEFALILPLMILIFLGGYELEDAITAERKVTATARTLANLTSEYSTVSDADVTMILQASAMVLTPYASTQAVLTVSEVSVDQNGNATVTWSRSLNGTARVTGSAVSLPEASIMPGMSMILGEVSYNYVPIAGESVMSSITMHDDLCMVPRQSATIPLTQ